ncbi:MAG TPA: D-hexose-6-phosphate mutarotase [Polyangiaceae bacterium]|nr:D-hexose-6-phosphate mutarotase [Polyangiaceae bacterium]
MSENESKFELELPGAELVRVHGLPAVRVRNENASGLVYLQGAHVAAFQPKGQEPVIWMSENALYVAGKALRGGVPICFPWFGPHAEQKEFPAHGFARTLPFEYRGARIDSSARTELAFVLESDEQTRAWFPYAFTASMCVAFGQSLRLELSVTNRDSQPFTFEEALHSYFAVSDVTQACVRGLEGARYIDKVREQGVFTEGTRELRFVAETDRVYESSATCIIEDRPGKRSLVIEKEGSGATVVWNPWRERATQMSDLGAAAWPRMLCVESANVGKSRVTLAPGASHRLAVTVSVLGIS